MHLLLARFSLEHQVRDSLAVLGLCAGIVEHCASGDCGARWRKASFAATSRSMSGTSGSRTNARKYSRIAAEFDCFGNDKVLWRDLPCHELFPLPLAEALHEGQIRGAEQDPVDEQAFAESTRAGLAHVQKLESVLETGFLHLLGRSDAIATDRLDAFGVEIGILLRLVVVLEANVALLCKENTGEVDLRGRMRARSSGLPCLL